MAKESYRHGELCIFHGIYEVWEARRKVVLCEVPLREVHIPLGEGDIYRNKSWSLQIKFYCKQVKNIKIYQQKLCNCLKKLKCDICQFDQLVILGKLILAIQVDYYLNWHFFIINDFLKLMVFLHLHFFLPHFN